MMVRKYICMVSIKLKVVTWPRIWFTLMNVPYTLESMTILLFWGILFCKWQLDPDSWCFSFGLPYLWPSQTLEFTGLCLLINLGCFQLLLFQMLVYRCTLSPILLGLWMICILERLLSIGPWGFVHLFTNLFFIFSLYCTDWIISIAFPSLSSLIFPLSPFCYWFHSVRF